MNDGTVVIDLRDTVMPKTDQMNADHLLTGPRIIKVRNIVRAAGKDQPTWIYYEGDEDKPYKPCTTMRRALGLIWGWDGSKYIGRGIKLYRDPTASFGGAQVGGIRISNLSHMKERVTLYLTSSKGQKKPVVIDPLTEEEFPTKEPATKSNEEFLEDLKYAAQDAAVNGNDALKEWWDGLSRAEQKAISPHMNGYKQQAKDAEAYYADKKREEEKVDSNE